MSFASFPASDLAKLVLGYLMEEQLMTVYDEFLQASPYLNAFVNEYDRLCMIPLRRILSEYRDMRLLVETCTPIELRRRLLQCSNLYDMVKFLVANVDLRKLCGKDSFTDHYRPKIAVLNCKTTSNKSPSAPLKSVDNSLKESTPLKNETNLVLLTEQDNESILSERMDETDPIRQPNNMVSSETQANLVLPETSDCEESSESELNNDSMVLEEQNDPILEEIVISPMQRDHRAHIGSIEQTTQLGQTERITDLAQTKPIPDLRQTNRITHTEPTTQLEQSEPITYLGQKEHIDHMTSIEQKKQVTYQGHKGKLISHLGPTGKITNLGQSERITDFGQPKQVQTSHLEGAEPIDHLRQTESVAHLGQTEPTAHLGQTEPLAHLGQSEAIVHLGQKEHSTYLGQSVKFNELVQTKQGQIVPQLDGGSSVEIRSFTDLPVPTPGINREKLTNDLNPISGMTSDIQRVYKRLSSKFQEYSSSGREIKPSIVTENVLQSENSTGGYPNTVADRQISPNFQPLTEINSNFVNPSNPNNLQSNIPVPLYNPVTLSNTQNNAPSTTVKDSQKIIILSNVKFDTPQPPKIFSNSIPQNPAVSQRNQQHKLNEDDKCIYTKDEIMAMPTVFVASPAKPTNKTNKRRPSVPSLKSLIVEVPNETSEMPIIDLSEETEHESKKANIIQTHLELLKSAGSKEMSLVQPQALLLTTAAPNEITLSRGIPMVNHILPNPITIPDETTAPNNMPIVTDSPKTPNIPLPQKKSSSTPRRSSHIRVLNFTTPRRPLSEAIIENCVSEEETVLSKSPNMINLAIGQQVGNTVIEQSITKTQCNEINVINKKINTKGNWDADLRALLQNDDELKSEPQPKIKSKSNKKKKKPPEDGSNKEKKSNKKNKTKSHKHKSSNKSKEVINELVESATDNSNVKPSIKVITERKHSRDSVKDDKLDKCTEVLPPQEGTPEVDTIFLQHAIGSKLSISDILETPYKQAIYDLQMETPRFLGPEFAGDPLSDIKIMNIPTPRFLSTPKVQSTPSYSSRHTDYSSGGSYYKPDDNDYPTILDDLALPSTSSPIEEVPKNVMKKPVKSNTPLKIDDKHSKTPNRRQSSRPVRKCTKNISYYDLANDKRSLTPIKTLESHSENKKDRLSIEIQPKSKTETTKKRSTPKINPRIKRTPNMKSVSKSKSNSISSRRASCKEITTNALIPNPSKSRRKSSTPRKLHCTKTFNSLNDQESLKSIKEDLEKEGTSSLCWNNDSSGESKSEVEDIAKIQAFIDKTSRPENNSDTISNQESALLHLELIKRGFDVATAKEIERDLTDKPASNNSSSSITLCSEEGQTTLELRKNKDTVIHNPSTGSQNTRLNTECPSGDECEEDLEFSINECDEQSYNFIEMVHDENRAISDVITPFKDTFCMEVCIEDVVIRLNTTQFMTLFTEEPKEVGTSIESNASERDHIEQENSNINEVNDFNDSYIRHYQEETEAAVQSISSSFDRFYTPRKQLTADEAKCVEIFDSSLASLDTPIKTYVPKHRKKNSHQNEESEQVNVFLIEQEMTGAQVTVEIESIEEKPETHILPKKRKRSNSTKDDGNVNKISKTQYLKNIQNIDIESVLSRLHGP